MFPVLAAKHCLTAGGEERVRFLFASCIPSRTGCFGLFRCEMITRRHAARGRRHVAPMSSPRRTAVVERVQLHAGVYLQLSSQYICT